MAGTSNGRQDLAAQLAGGEARPGWSRLFGKNFPTGKLAVGLLAGCALGVLGLPRLSGPLSAGPAVLAPRSDLASPAPTTAPGQAPPALGDGQQVAPTSATGEVQLALTPAPGEVQGQVQLALTPARGEVQSAPDRGQSQVPTPTLVAALATDVLETAPTPGMASAPAGPLFADRFAVPLPNWPNDPNGTGWFADGVFRMFARQAGRFVAVGVPLPAPLAAATISAQFHKVGGPAGGGYGIIIRHQGAWSDGEAASQLAEFIVLEVGDRGDVGIWQRDQARWIDIVGWTHADAVKRDREPNALLVTMDHASLRFDVNGQQVANVIYNGLPQSGNVGVFVGGDLNDVALESLRIDTLHN